MHFIVFVEGDTEDRILSYFLSKWLRRNLPERVGIRTVNFKGYANLFKDAAQKAIMHLQSPHNKELIAVFGLLDLYGPNFYPEDIKTVEERYQWAKRHMEDKVNSPRFKQHFAVHELEAWLISDPSIFPKEIAPELEEAAEAPEKINSNQPPAKFLHDLYINKFNRTYKKVTEGNRLFAKLDPEVVREKCPYFKLFTDDLLKLARDHMTC